MVKPAQGQSRIDGNSIPSTKGRKHLRVALTAAVTLAAAALASVPAYAISGGDPVTVNKPWASSVQGNGNHRCTATLIGSQWVLTAFHCVIVNVPDSVRIGSLDNTMGGELIEIERIVPYPDAWFDEPESTIKGTDLALIKLARPAISSPMPLITEEIDRHRAFKALGWGQTDWNGTRTTLLHELNVFLSSPEQCGDTVSAQVCMIDPNDRGVLPGDSGGPLLIQTVVGWQLAGVVTSTGRNAAGNHQSNWIDLSVYRDWIVSVLGADGTES